MALSRVMSRGTEQTWEEGRERKRYDHGESGCIMMFIRWV